jgi:hypothetical protein
MDDGWRAVLVLGLLGFAIVADGGLAQPATAALGDDVGGGATTCLAADDETLWIGTRGAGLFRMTTEGTEHFDDSRGLLGMRVHDCALAGGQVWVATDAVLARFDAEAGRFETARIGAFSRLAASERGLWASGADGGVVRIDLLEGGHDASRACGDDVSARADRVLARLGSAALD